MVGFWPPARAVPPDRRRRLPGKEQDKAPRLSRNQARSRHGPQTRRSKTTGKKKEDQIRIQTATTFFFFFFLLQTK